MSFSFECFAVTHIGNHRKSNEDNFYIGENISPEEQLSMSQIDIKSIHKEIKLDGTLNRIFAVSDGMGGHDYGEVASYIVTSALDEFSTEQSVRVCRSKSEKFEFIQAFQEMIDNTNLKINEFANEKNVFDNMGATLSGVIFFSDEAAPINIGDSTTFLFEKGKLQKMTRDDNESTMFEDNPSKKLVSNGKRLTKYFGLPSSNGVLTATISKPINLKSGQIYLIASDGLTDSLTENEISQIILAQKDNTENAVNILLENSLNNENGGRDNITIVLIKVSK